MKNHYKTLGITRKATLAEIRAAFKMLALRYHPDKNPGNPAAEEIFKEVNEAYHILNDKVKKQKYDMLLDYESVKPTPQIFNNHYRYKPPVYKAKYPKTYKFDKSYFKHQAFAILFVLFIASLVLGVTKVNRYYNEKEREETRFANLEAINKAHAMFSMGDFHKALQVVQRIASKNPSDYGASQERDKMVQDLYQKAQRLFILRDYHNAIYNLLIAIEFQEPMNLEMYQYLAKSFVAIKDYKKAVATYEYIYLRDMQNLNLIITIGNLYYHNLNDPAGAIEYYDKAKNIFKERQSKLYGNAFELLMDPENTPDLYYNIFYNKAKANLSLNRFDIAVTDCNWAIFLRKEQAEPYYLRAISYFQLNEKQKACEDILAAKKQGYTIPDSVKICD